MIVVFLVLGLGAIARDLVLKTSFGRRLPLAEARLWANSAVSVQRVQHWRLVALCGTVVFGVSLAAAHLLLRGSSALSVTLALMLGASLMAFFVSSVLLDLARANAGTAN